MTEPYRNAYAQPHGPPEPAVAICGRCGVVAPEQGRECAVCKQPLASVRVQVQAQGDDTFWVAVRAGFTCRQCSFLAPIDHLDVDGAVDCAHCGLHQKLDPERWYEPLATAHAVGDLAGPAPEGRRPHPFVWIGDENPHHAIGVTETFASTRSGHGGGALEIELSPGHPTCSRCHVPTQVAVAPGRAMTTCPRCHESATYTLPEAAQKLEPALVAVVAEELRTDRPKARSMPAQAGVVALSCPGCGAPLTNVGADRLHTCEFCRAVCVIPSRAIARINQNKIEALIWWLLFRGPSRARAELEKPPVASPTSDARKAVLKALALKRKLGRDLDDGGDKDARVEEAPEEPGPNWPQIALTIALGLVALVIGWLVTGS